MQQTGQNNLESIGLRVADHVSAMLAYWDRNLVCRFANAAYIDWFGRTREEMVNKITLPELLGPPYEKNLPYILGALEGKPQTFEREITVPAGGIRQSLASYFPDIVNGEVHGFFVHVADISQIKLLERELLQSSEIIKEQNRRLLNFSNIVSHNLKSYAGNLRTILDLFLKADSHDEKEVMLGYLQSISNGFSITVNHLTQIVDIQNTTELKLEQIRLNSYIEQSLDVIKVQVKSANAIIRNNVNPEITLIANPAYMESILLNLITNAIKYKHPDRAPVIDFDATVKKNKLELRITDNGLGINLEKYKTDLFGMYKTFHGNADAKGIGLFITRLQVEAMGGQVDVESEEGRGSSFVLLFPLYRNSGPESTT